MDYLPHYLGVLVLAAVAGHTLSRATEWIHTGEPPAPIGRALKLFRRPAPEPEPIPGVLWELELARVARQLEQVRKSETQGLALRITACTIAYDEALIACCRSYGLEAPSGPRPLTAGQRLQAESALLGHGVQW